MYTRVPLVLYGIPNYLCIDLQHPSFILGTVHWRRKSFPFSLFPVCPSVRPEEAMLYFEIHAASVDFERIFIFLQP